MHIDHSASHTRLRITRDTERPAGVKRALPCQRDGKVISEEDRSSQSLPSFKLMDFSCVVLFQQVNMSSRKRRSLLKGVIVRVEGTIRAKSVVAEQD